MCDWYKLCHNPPVGTVTHPILGEVPTCEPCAAKHDLALKPRRFDVETFDILADTTLTPEERDAKLEALMGDVTAEADRLHPNI